MHKRQLKTSQIAANHQPILLYQWCQPVWPEKNPKMSIKVSQKFISLEKWYILTPLQKLPKNVGDLGNLIVAKGVKNLPKVQ